MTYIRHLPDIATDDPAAGGKMTRLADLARAGLTVPHAFVVTTDAFQAVAAACDLPSALDRELAGLGADDSAGLARAEQRLRERLAGAPLPPDLTEAVAGAYEQLCAASRDALLPVAVRSSATTEDAVASSSAGQYDTYLGLTGAPAVLDGILRCWGSLFGARALSYRIRNGLSHVESTMAVGIVELVHARASGVAFSLNPVTGRRDRIVVEATFGFGEALVQGVVTPDHLEVGRADRRILSYAVGDKQTVSAMDHRAGQVVEVAMPEPMRTLRVLAEDEIGALVDAVLAAEEMLGAPADVEWVIPRAYRSGDPVTLVQVRPVTTAVAQPAQTWNAAAMALKYAFKGIPQ
ncbi:PEP/pyruvate-binding domain-containing protein [Nonomuraea turcica]|uniref:PEP/pyruvate-binding domain-containing protein n=1 Tax=Nonomuraea sp. G32 TaxID=3067274 RepID=UPI00273BFF1B|nr:PEP/pyruvate-binding domain-containing protein [Nonomuraea sp. G32]MDP4510185.1 PEP/pyruvate-binding domain-containing protein [Nonomuraea sp. G32]